MMLPIALAVAAPAAQPSQTGLTAPARITVKSDPATYDLAGFRLGMAESEVEAALKARGLEGMVEGLKRGFAVANTDMGTAPDINGTSDHPERWVDFGYRATHEMTRVAKRLVSAFYNVSEFRSYFAGCSTGGQQAVSAAQRYPSDYDGILAGDPGNNRTHVASYFL